MAEVERYDVLGGVLELTRLRGRVYCQTVTGAPWGLRLDSSPDVVFHLVVSGSCFVFFGERRLQLGAGDVVLLPHGIARALADHARSRRLPLAEWLSSGPSRRLGGRGAESRVLCGVYSFDLPGPRHPILQALPELVFVSAAKTRQRPELAETIAALTREHEGSGLGSSMIVSRLLDVLFVQVLRVWIDDQPAGGAGWMGALRDSLVGAALSLLHNHLAAPWSVETLAARLGTSRPTLARRFVAEVGVSPVAYLTQARMLEAARLVRDTDLSLSEVAQAVGYSSEFAFNRAFRRENGTPPGAIRRGRSAKRA